MDKNTGIGLTLIAVLLLLYFYFFAPKTEPPAKKTVTTGQAATSDSSQVITDSTESSNPATVHHQSDSLQQIHFGSFASYLKGQEKNIPVENDEVRIVFSNRGGVIKYLELKKFKTYYQKPLILLDSSFAQQHLLARLQGQELDLYSLYYNVTTRHTDAGTQITFSLDNGSVVQEYTVPDHGYQIGYSLSIPGADRMFNSDVLGLVWDVDMPIMEKNHLDTRMHSSVTWYRPAAGFDELSSRSNSSEQETFADSVKWIALKEKFFLSAMIADKDFSGGHAETSVDPNDTTIVKHATAKVFIPTAYVANRPATLRFYFGPNDYKSIGSVAPEFRSNVYVGWTPVKYVNKYLIIPIFYFLVHTVGNIGLIVIILVLVIRLILLPLSFKSYKSMAKMRLLKPELDELKEKVGGDQQKMQQEQLKLYQQVGVNPLSGCIPMLLQMPILLSMFYLFPNMIELRQQPFLWAEDLSTYDSIAHLPFTIPFYGNHVSLFTLLMTITTLIYTWQNNQLTSVQGPMKSMSYIMPVVFLAMLNSYPAGLSFYYTISTLVTFGQQSVIKRFVDEGKIRKMMDENKKRVASGGKKSKFMAKLEGAMKASEEARKKARK